MTKKQTTYTALITRQIAEMFENEECENRIDKEDFAEGCNATDFFFAINAASTFLYNEMTGDNLDLLGYNHISNRLIAQNIQIEKNDK